MPRQKKATPKRAPREVYGEVKERYNINLTPSVVAYLDKQATAAGISRSEYLERLVRTEMAGVLEFSEQELTDIKKLSA